MAHDKRELCEVDVFDRLRKILCVQRCLQYVILACQTLQKAVVFVLVHKVQHRIEQLEAVIRLVTGVQAVGISVDGQSAVPMGGQAQSVVVAEGAGLLGRFLQREVVGKAASRQPCNVGPRGVLHPALAADRLGPFEDGVPEGDPKLAKQVVQAWDVAASRGGSPPAARVVIEEAEVRGRLGIVPLGEDDDAESLFPHIRSQFCDLLRIEDVFGVDDHQRPVLQRMESAVCRTASGQSGPVMR